MLLYRDNEYYLGDDIGDFGLQAVGIQGCAQVVQAVEFLFRQAVGGENLHEGFPVAQWDEIFQFLFPEQDPDFFGGVFAGDGGIQVGGRFGLG